MHPNFRKAVSFIRKILKEKKKTLIFCDMDADGFASALQLALLFDFNKVPYSIRRTKSPDERNNLEKEVFKYIEGFDYVIFLDFTISEKILEEIEKPKILVIDHHNAKYKKFLFYDVSLEKIKEEDKPSTSAILFNILKETKNKNFKRKENDFAFIALIGAYGDFLLLGSLKFMKINKNLINLILINKILNPTILEFIVLFVSYVSFSEKNFFKAYKFFKQNLKSKTFQHMMVFEKHKLKKFYVELFSYWEALKKTLNKELKKTEILGNFVFLEMTKTSRSKRAIIAQMLRLLHPDKPSCVATFSDNMFFLSFRSPHTDLIKLFKSLSRKIGSFKGGGHKLAAGAKLDTRKDLEKLKNILKNYKN